MDEIRSLVWTDYRLALLFLVISPIILLLWALVARIESIQKLLIIYWRVSSLLLITVYLMIPSWPVGFITAFAAKILIPISLWFWVDLNDEIKDLPKSLLKLALNTWRWIVTVYASLGAIALLPFLSCAFSAAIEKPFCQVWLEAPWQYAALIHPSVMLPKDQVDKTDPSVLGFLGMVGLVFYLLYFIYFVFVRLSKQGRSALEQ